MGRPTLLLGRVGRELLGGRLGGGGFAVGHGYADGAPEWISASIL